MPSLETLNKRIQTLEEEIKVKETRLNMLKWQLSIEKENRDKLLEEQSKELDRE